MCRAFGNHIHQSPNAPLVVKKYPCPMHSKNYKKVHSIIKYWQSMHDYKYFLTESKVHFDSSERKLLHTKLWEAWQKLQLLDTDKTMQFLLPLYSSTGRPAMNQPQILRSFILLFLLYSEVLSKLSLTLWIGRLWVAPSTDLYARDKLLPTTT